MVNLLELCEDLKIEIENLKAENKALKIENAQLKEKLGLNSKNSSIPSSKELYKIKKRTSKKNSMYLASHVYANYGLADEERVGNGRFFALQRI